jgi:uncharacterized membrane protein
VFLAGTGAYQQFARGKSKSELSRFLISRGLWLIVLEFTIVRLSVLFNIDRFNIDRGFLGMPRVIWVIGVSMIVLAGLIHLPLKVVAAFGLAMIFLHNLLDKYQVGGMAPGSPEMSVWAKLWMVLHKPGLFPIAGPGSPIVLLLYPLIPWIGVMAVGYALGALSQREASNQAAIVTGHRRTSHRVVCDSSRHRPLWRTVEMVASREPGLYHFFVCEHEEIPSFAALPADDVGAGHSGSGLV